MNGSILSPNTREQMEQRPGGIGSRAVENQGTGRPRAVATDEISEQVEIQQNSTEEQENVEAKTCPNTDCSHVLDSAWIYCPRCGVDLLSQGAGKRLGLTFTKDDVQDYIFKGFVLRDLKLLGSHTITLKTSQPEDLESIDDFIMNGKWAQNAEGSDKKVSDFHLRQKNQLCVTAASVLKVDGNSIGESLNDRATWLNGRGSAFVDMVSQRVVLFNQAFTEFLKKEDTLPGS